MRKLKLTLIDNSDNFLVEALQNAVLAESDTTRWKYAVINLVQSIELVMKARLEKEHPALLYSNIDKPRNTVSLEKALGRLVKIAKVEFSTKDIEAIEIARGWRNSIIHYEFSLSVKEAKAVFARLFAFLREFNRRSLNRDLADFLPTNLWEASLGIAEYLDHLVERAKVHLLEEEIDHRWVWLCRKCGQHFFIVQDDSNTCLLCSHYEETQICESCGEPKYLDNIHDLTIDVNEFSLESHFICDECLDDIVEQELAYWN